MAWFEASEAEEWQYLGSGQTVQLQHYSLISAQLKEVIFLGAFYGFVIFVGSKTSAVP